MRTALLLVFAMLAAPVLAAEQTVWKWVDDRGVTHYSDRPVPGATKIELNASTPSRSSSADYSSAPATATSQEEAGPAYSTFEVWKPSEGETVANTGGEVQVNIRVEPPLAPGHSLDVYLDGRLIETPDRTALERSLSEVPRGEHRVVAVITDRAGQRVQQTEGVTFYVRQTSVANPPVGPALRQPPKPAPRPGANNKLPSKQPTYAALNGERPRIDPITNAPVKSAPKEKPKKKP